MSARGFLRVSIVALVSLAGLAAYPGTTHADSFQVIGSNVYYIDDNGTATNQGAASYTGSNGVYSGGTGNTQYTWQTQQVGDKTYVTKITNNQTGEVNTVGYDANYNIVSNTASTDPSQATQGTLAGDIKGAASTVKQVVTNPVDTLSGGVASALSSLIDFIIKGIGKLFEILGYYLWMFASGVLYVAGQILNYAITALVNDMGAYTDLWTAVRDGWKAIRDIGNTLFIFVLLYAAFNTVLGLKNGLDLVPRIIVVALLVNFSYLFAVSIIDASNELASKVYTELAGSNTTASADAGFSGQLAELAGAKDFILAKTDAVTTSGVSGGSSSGTAPSALGGFSYFIRAVFQSAFMFVLSGFMIAIVFTLIARFVTLVVLCVVSALAFLSYLLPKFRQHSNDWWAALIGQSFYAPAIFLMLLITTGIAEKVGKSALVKSAAGTGTNAASQFENLLSFGLGEFFNFCILMGLLYASMVIAKKISEQGSSAAISVGRRVQNAAAAAAFGGAGWVGRGTLGRAGEALSNLNSIKNMSVQSGWRGAVGRRLMGVGGRMQDSSFDFRKTGASAALSAATNADYGKVSGPAEKGWKGVAEAREKKVAERIDAVKKWDVSKGDKEKYMKDTLAEERRLNGGRAVTSIGRAQETHEAEHANVQAAESALEVARRGGNAAAIAAATTNVNDAKLRRQVADEARYQQYNKQFYGVDSTSKSVNYSTKYAQSLQDDANSRAAIWTKTAAGGIGALGVGALATVSAPAAIAVGALGAGRVISGTIRGIRTRNSQVTDSRGRTQRQGFLRGLARNQAVHAAAGEALEKETKAQGWRENVARLDELERTRGAAGLTGAEKTEREKDQKKIDKHENAGKKAD